MIVFHGDPEDEQSSEDEEDGVASKDNEMLIINKDGDGNKFKKNSQSPSENRKPVLRSI